MSDILTDIICPNSTISQAKEYLRKRWFKGETCPCCNQFVKRYKRRITSTMALGLIYTFKNFGVNTPFHFESFWKTTPEARHLPNNPDFYKLAYWGLIIQPENIEKKHEGAKTSGYWQITPLGELFIKRQVALKEYAIVYNSKCFSFEGEDLFIGGCFKKGFDFNELTKGVQCV